MDYFQGVVTEYLVAEKSTYVNTELLIQLDSGVPAKGRYWYCDAAAVNFSEKTVYLCEVTYSKTMSSLAKRLLAWNENWDELVFSMRRDSKIPNDWSIQPWAFIPEQYHSSLKNKIASIEAESRMPYPRITYLESVVPWKYVTWDRKVAALEDNS